MERPAGSEEYPRGFQPPSSSSEASSSKPEPEAKSPSPAANPSAAPAQESKPEVQAEDDPMVGGEDDEAKAKKEAEELKVKGNTEYKAKKFDEAISLYQKAWDTWPKDITFLTNLSGMPSLVNLSFTLTNLAVYFEQGNYDECIATCEKAVEEGRDLRADYKTMAKFVLSATS